MRIACTIPVTSADNEWENSTALNTALLKLYADYHDDRKTVWLMKIHYKRPVDYDAVADDISRKQPRRMLLVDPDSVRGSVISQSECLKQKQVNEYNFQS